MRLTFEPLPRDAPVPVNSLENGVILMFCDARLDWQLIYLFFSHIVRLALDSYDPVAK